MLKHKNVAGIKKAGRSDLESVFATNSKATCGTRENPSCTCGLMAGMMVRFCCLCFPRLPERKLLRHQCTQGTLHALSWSFHICQDSSFLGAFYGPRVREPAPYARELWRRGIRCSLFPIVPTRWPSTIMGWGTTSRGSCCSPAVSFACSRCTMTAVVIFPLGWSCNCTLVFVRDWVTASIRCFCQISKRY